MDGSLFGRVAGNCWIHGVVGILVWRESWCGENSGVAGLIELLEFWCGWNPGVVGILEW